MYVYKYVYIIYKYVPYYRGRKDHEREEMIIIWSYIWKSHNQCHCLYTNFKIFEKTRDMRNDHNLEKNVISSIETWLKML